MTDLEWMTRALTLAARGRGLTSPNPMVGAIVVRDGAVLAERFHERAGASHAEAAALAAAGARARGATLYVTLEPCNHVGRTPPCVDAIIRAGHPPGRVGHAGSQPAGEGWGSRRPRRRRHRGHHALPRAGRARAQPDLLHRGRAAAAPRHRQVGHDPRRQDRGLRPPLAVDHRRGGATGRAPAPKPERRHRDRHRDRARRRSGADRAPAASRGRGSPIAWWWTAAPACRSRRSCSRPEAGPASWSRSERPRRRSGWPRSSRRA